MCIELEHIRMGHKIFRFQNYKTEVAVVQRNFNIKVNKWQCVDPLWYILISITNTCDRADWINLTQDSIQCRTPVNIVMKSKFARKAANCLTRSINTSC
jgi:hypothetical protein